MLLALLTLFLTRSHAVINEAELQLAYTSAIIAAEQNPQVESGEPIDYEFTIGRATNYAYNNNGACGFGPIFPDEGPLSDPLYILAIPTCAAIFPGSCGSCWEVKCRNAVITDDLGAELDRTSACYDEDVSVVLRNVDECAGYYPPNQASNARWCSCQNLAHFDISTEAFSQLADLSYGVIGTQWRRVACDYQPESPAPVRTTQRFADPLPDPSQDQHRTFPDWSALKGSWVTVEDFQALNPGVQNPPNLYSSAAGNLLPGWKTQNVMTGDAQNASEPAPPPPVTTGRGGQGEPICRWSGRGEGIAFSATSSFTAVNSTLIQFWVYTDNFTSADLMLTIGDQNDTSTICEYAYTESFSATSENAGWLSYSVAVASLQVQSCGNPIKVFYGCGGKDASQFDSLYILNPLPAPQWICLDDLLWR